MDITYSYKKDFTSNQLEGLFTALNWSSGKYPAKLVAAMKNSGFVCSAWDGDKLVALANVLDDGVMTAYVHFVLVLPKYQKKGIGEHLINEIQKKYKDYLRIVLISYDESKGFYEKYGFKRQGNTVPMSITAFED